MKSHTGACPPHRWLVRPRAWPSTAALNAGPQALILLTIVWSELVARGTQPFCVLRGSPGAARLGNTRPAPVPGKLVLAAGRSLSSGVCPGDSGAPGLYFPDTGSCAPRAPQEPGPARGLEMDRMSPFSLVRQPLSSELREGVDPASIGKNLRAVF